MTFKPFASADRRSVLKAGAWGAPVVMAASAVPAYAASAPSTEFRSLTADYGLFVQVINSNPDNPYDTYVGVHSYEAPTASADGSNGVMSVGAGTFTPGGTTAPGQYSGAGFWVSVPKDAESGQEVEGVTRLAAGSEFEMTYTFTFNDEFAVTDPLLWSPSAAGPYLPLDNRSTDRV